MRELLGSCHSLKLVMGPGQKFLHQVLSGHFWGRSATLVLENFLKNLKYFNLD